jgi:hypothetical protein
MLIRQPYALPVLCWIVDVPSEPVRRTERVVKPYITELIVYLLERERERERGERAEFDTLG